MKKILLFVVLISLLSCKKQHVEKQDLKLVYSIAFMRGANTGFDAALKSQKGERTNIEIEIEYAYKLDSANIYEVIY